MSGQGSLFDDDEPAPVRPGRPGLVVDPAGDGREQTLFFALLAPPEVAQRLVAGVPELQRQHGLGGRPIGAERLHVTLCAAAKAVGCDMPTEFIEAARAVARGVRHAAIELRFDHAETFTNSGAVVLTGAGNAAVTALSRLLVGPLKRNGLAGEGGSSPHLTLFYDKRHRLEAVPVEPVSWTSVDFVLLLSHVGQSRYDELGRWPLLG